MAQVASLLAKIAAQGASFLAGGGDEARKSLIVGLTKLAASLETPMETTLRYNWGASSCIFAINTGISMKLFDHLSETEAKSSAQLGEATKSDPVFLARLLKHMAAMDVLVEQDHDRYLATPFAASLKQPTYHDWFRLCNMTLDPAYTNGPEFYAKTNYQNPTDMMNCAFQHGLKTEDNWFAWLASHPPGTQVMGNAMAGYSALRKMWLEDGCYPVKANLIDGADTTGSAPLMVDIGGGTGRDVNAFRTRFGGRCVLAELPEVAKTATVVEGVEVVEYDFMKGPPIAGARAYYLHSVLHDWPDAEAAKILTNIKAAMKPGYSKLLINENVIPSKDAYWMTTGQDLIMMNLFASSERTEEGWRSLLETNGLRVTNIYTYELGSHSLIEAEVA